MGCLVYRFRAIFYFSCIVLFSSLNGLPKFHKLFLRSILVKHFFCSKCMGKWGKFGHQKQYWWFIIIFFSEVWITANTNCVKTSHNYIARDKNYKNTQQDLYILYLNLKVFFPYKKIYTRFIISQFEWILLVFE